MGLTPALLLLAASTLPPQAHYVAMGSSFAAGPGVLPAETPPTRCGRSTENYPHQLARRLSLSLTDVSCSGATTGHLLAPWRELPPQLDALRPDTALVTLTIGGNDIGYIGSLISSACPSAPDTPICQQVQPPKPPTKARWQALAQNLDTLTAEIRRRAPHARLIFVDYLTVLPGTGTCAPLTPAEARAARQTARRLARLTAQAARKAGADLIPASRLSTTHHACANTPWMTSFPAPVPYHPTNAGMTAITDALEARLRQK